MEPKKIYYEIVKDGEAIKCLICEMVSYGVGDIVNKWCGKCKVYLNPGTVEELNAIKRKKEYLLKKGVVVTRA